MLRVGVISDTHGLLRPEAIAALQDADHIVHAGDIGSPEILQALGEIAPVTAVRGNNDRAAWAKQLPGTATLTIGNVKLYVLHDLGEMNGDPARRGIDVVISGHSHKPRIQQGEDVLFVNPGSAGPRRFTLPIALAILDIDRDAATGRIETLVESRK